MSHLHSDEYTSTTEQPDTAFSSNSPATEKEYLNDNIFEEVFETSSLGKFLLASDGSILQMNTAMAKMTGRLSPRTSATDTLSLGALIDDTTKAEHLIHALLHGQNCRLCAIEYTRPDTTQITINLELYPAETTESPVIAEGIVRSHDVISFNDMQKHLHNCMYWSMVEYTNDIVYLLDSNAVIQYVNPAVSTLLGYNPADLYGKHLLTIITPEYRQIVTDGITVVKSGIRLNREIQVIAADGSYLFFDTSSFLLNDNEHCDMIMGVAHDITSRRKAEQALRENETILAEAQRVAQLGWWEYTFSSQTCKVTPIVRDILGLPGDQCVYELKDIKSTIFADDLITIVDTVTDAVANNQPIDLIVRIINTDQPFTYVHLRAEIEYGPKRTPSRFMGVVQDITTVKTIERDLSLFRSLVETAGQGICVTRTNGAIIYMNRACSNMLDADMPERYHEKLVRILFPPQIRKRLQTDVITTVQNGNSWSGELPLQTTLNHYRPVYATVVPIADISGNDDVIAWVFTDITELKESATELRTANEFLSNIVNAITDPVIIRDESLCFVLLNDAAAELMGRPKHTIIGTRSLDFLPPGVGKRVDEADSLVIETGNAPAVEIIINKQDVPKTMLEKKTRFIDPGTGHRYTITVIRDISDIKRIEQELTLYRDQLEDIVDRRTQELVNVNRKLHQEIEERRNVEERLRKSEDSLEEKAINLQDANTALKVLIEYQDAEKEKLGDNIRNSIRSLVNPYLEKLSTSLGDAGQQMLLHIIETNLAEIMRPFSKTLLSGATHLSMTEVQIAKLTSDGRTAKEIAGILAISENTVKVHKRNIRKKLAITGSHINLRTHLQHLFDDNTLAISTYNHSK